MAKHPDTMELLRALPDRTPANVAAAFDLAVAADPLYWVSLTTIEEYAACRGISVPAARQERHLGTGPASYKAEDSRSVMFPPRVEIVAWMREKYGLPPIPENPLRDELLRKATVAFDAEQARQKSKRKEREERKAANDDREAA